MPVTHTTVQLLHPRFNRLGRSTGTYILQAGCQQFAALRHRVIGEVEVIINSLKVQNGSGNLDSNRRRGRRASTRCCVHRRAECGDQGSVFGVQFGDGLTYRSKLLYHRSQAPQVAPGQGRPAFCCRSQSASCLRKMRRIKPSKRGRFVINLPILAQYKCAPNCAKHRRTIAVDRLGHCAKKQHVLCNALGRRLLAGSEAAEFGQDTRCRAPNIDVIGQQTQGDSFKKTSGNGPEAAAMQGAFPGCQSRAGVRHLRGVRAVECLDDGQHSVPQSPTHRWLVMQGRPRTNIGDVSPLPVVWPKVGWVNSLGACEFHQRALLREKSDRRSLASFKCAFQIVHQGPAGVLHVLGCVVGTGVGPLHKFLGQRLHGTQHFGQCLLPHHFQSTGALVKLAPGHAQITGVKVCHMSQGTGLCVPHESTNCGGSASERLA